MKKSSTVESLLRTRAERTINHALSRNAGEDRKRENLKFLLSSEQFVVVLQSFAKPESQIQYNIFYSELSQTLQSCCKIVAYFQEKVVVMWVLLHLVGCCGSVHVYVRH